MRYEFPYDSQGLLTAITDGDGNQTVIERDPSGNATTIVAPDGQRTALTLDTNGYLASVSNPAGENTGMTYTADGLLTSFTDANGHASRNNRSVKHPAPDTASAPDNAWPDPG